jgi:membrane protease YdiL (CAAX protease family)
MTPLKKAVLALLLLVPAPSVGVLFGMVIFPNSTAGVVLFGLSKLWLFGLPVLWLRFVEREPFSFSPPRHGGFMPGMLSGLLLSGIIFALYWTMGESFIDRRLVTEKLMAVGFGSPAKYAVGTVYWVLVNSVLEEYVWRWFCVTQCERLLPKRLAVLGSALFFTLHHAVAMAVYFKTIAVVLCSIGVFLGGAIWSLMYLRYRSVWPGYVSHAIVDLCIFGIGAAILFGAK